jgi:predicted component of viral defense system (DUF524 family)
VPATASVDIGLAAPFEGVILHIAILPQTEELEIPLLLDNESAPDTEPPVPATQLLEGAEYLYEWSGLPANVTHVVAEPVEVFQPDTPSGMRGRLRPGLFTGTLPISVVGNDILLGNLEVEVRARKLSYRSEYRWMLRDIANQVTELVMDRFAVSGLTYTHDSARDAVTLYERFAFLRELMMGEAFQSALAQVLHRPHVAWEESHELIRPGASIKADSNIQRQLASKAGSRMPWTNGPISSLPMRLDRRRTDATHDTPPNRFVKFALEHWRDVVLGINEGLRRMKDSPVKARGLRETSQLTEQLDALLHHDLFDDVGVLSRFPSDDQVLQRREGYREIFRAYLEFELAARLSWQASESEYFAGQRDVATLYEHWVFIQVANAVARLVGQSFDLRPLVELSKDGLNLVLRAGSETVVKGCVERVGRQLQVELCFNRTFRGGESGSWTRPMRPDFALVISPADAETTRFEPVVLLFDAKYRVQLADELFGSSDETIGDGLLQTDRRKDVKRDDLIKMHAYRDAIRRAAGAFVLYPGTDDSSKREFFPEYHELLPGLGAFILRPTAQGEALGVAALTAFIDDVFDHVTARLTQHERGRHWLREVYDPPNSEDATLSEIALGKPLPNTPVLLGYVKSAAHWNWVIKKRTYNVRTIGRVGGVTANADMLRSRFLLLYCPSLGKVALTRIISDPEFVARQAMERAGYPKPRGDYLCVQWAWGASQEWLGGLSADDVDRFVKNLGSSEGAPTPALWQDVVRLAFTQ